MGRGARLGEYHGVRQRRCYQLVSVAAPALLVAGYAPLHGLQAVIVLIQAVLVELFLLLGPAAMNVVVDDRGVTVRNLFRVTRIGWADVRGFSIDEGFPWTARVERASGRDVIVWGVSAEPWLSRGKEQRRILKAVEELNGAWRTAVLSGGHGVVPATAEPVAAESVRS
ncbi:MAG TPA: PH domain-containing protein [Acidimicrobiales bacterium]|nr:PH domain-containing protein [Acidimicrobiales bacterium]